MINRVISWYAKLSHDWPWLVLLAHVLWVFGLSALVIMGKHLDFGEGGGESWLIISEEMVTRFDAFNQARDMLPLFNEETTALERNEAEGLATTYFIYSAPGDNMLTPDGLRVMKQVEEVFLTHEDYPDFCLLDYDEDNKPVGCARPMSVLAQEVMFPDASWDGNRPKYPDLEAITQKEIDDRLRVIASNPQLKYALGFSFDSNFGKPCDQVPDKAPGEECDGYYLKSKYVRSLLEPLGKPLADTGGKKEGKVVDEYIEKLDKALFKELNMKGGLLSTPMTKVPKIDGIQIVFFSQLSADRDFSLTVNGDLMWAGASLMAVFAYMAIHTRSLLISTVGMLSVIFSFVLAVFAVKLVFQVQYMDMMLVLIIFVTLGIGADDVFVFVDAFKQSEAVAQACGSLLSRLDYTMNRSCKAIFVTSLTTMVAFFMTSISDLVNIRAFGLYAGMNIFFLFVLSCLVLPPTIVIWERNFSHLPCCVCHSACLCCGSLKMKTQAKLEGKERAMAERSTKRIDTSSLDAPMAMKMDPEAGTQEKDELISALDPTQAKSQFAVDGESLGMVERFFYGPYMKFLEKAKYAIILVFVGLAGLGIFFVLQLAPPTESEKFMPDYHMVTKFEEFFSPSGNYWAASDTTETENVWIVWGIKGMDLSTRASSWNVTDRGTIIWDDEFNPYTEEAQNHLLNACPIMRTTKCRETTVGCDESTLPGEDTRWLVRRTPDNPEGEGYCWPLVMQDWLQGTEWGTMPLPPDDFKAALLEFYEEKKSKVRSRIGFIEDANGELELKYLAIKFPSSFQAPRSDSVTGAVMYDWEKATENLNSQAKNAEGMDNAFMTSGFPFVWLFTQRSLVRNAIMGLALVFAIGFVVINLATMNVSISIISLVTIAGIILTVLGIGAKGISGWEFGMAESIATVILIGFSMDYCLHLGGAYIESEEETRYLRTRDALVHLGVSVVAGAITTILSGLFLWGTVMVFFQKFAFLITFTVVVSFLWAVVFLPAALLTVGPEGNFGNWVAILSCGRHGKVQPTHSES